MAIHRKFLFSKLFGVLLVGILLILAVLIAYFIQNNLNEDLAKTKSDAQQQFQSIASIISTEMSAEQYQNIDPLFKQWAQSDDDILEMKLIAANGFSIASFKRARADRHFFELAFPVKFSYHDEAILQVRVSLEDVYARNQKIFIKVTVLFLIFSVLLVFLLLMAAQLHREAGRSSLLADLYLSLIHI